MIGQVKTLFQHLQTVSHYRSLLSVDGCREFCCQLALSQGRTSASYFISIISNMVPHFMSHIHTSYISYLLCLLTHKLTFHILLISHISGGSELEQLPIPGRDLLRPEPGGVRGPLPGETA